MNIVAVILARGGSKGLLKKNIRELAGRPLIAYTIEAACMARTVSRVIVSTDSPEIAQVARDQGAEVPFLRPADLSNDEATSEVALTHAIEWLRDNDSYVADIVVYLQITDLFRMPAMIDQCVQALIENPDIDSAFMGHVEHKNYWRKTANGFERLANDMPYGIPRQKREPVFREDTGVALASRADVILSGRRIGDQCHIIPYEQDASFIDIHTEFDLWLSDVLIQQKGIVPNEKM